MAGNIVQPTMATAHPPGALLLLHVFSRTPSILHPHQHALHPTSLRLIRR
ncbi:Protein of unknown function [Pyronema omphalodes CBS 100304]|uniref:Uncharacterized protein n=1 Tax=Pyronema omphalodes (strain CBS 100304) TaxID=1076935 RepID=U4L5Q1_PYROM|nr:Protein of unknown function [Pyronema omphalodes CBS 100304]